MKEVKSFIENLINRTKSRYPTLNIQVSLNEKDDLIEMSFLAPQNVDVSSEAEFIVAIQDGVVFFLKTNFNVDIEHSRWFYSNDFEMKIFMINLLFYYLKYNKKLTYFEFLSYILDSQITNLLDILMYLCDLNQIDYEKLENKVYIFGYGEVILEGEDRITTVSMKSLKTKFINMDIDSFVLYLSSIFVSLDIMDEIKVLDDEDLLLDMENEDDSGDLPEMEDDGSIGNIDDSDLANEENASAEDLSSIGNMTEGLE